jgi:curved DNA-binding protein CbpA
VAYRGLARRLHPDGEGGDAQSMVVVNEAWRVLGDADRRRAYDATLDLPLPDAEAPELLADIGPPAPRSLRLIFAIVLVSMAVVFMAILLIGFGRVGVTPKP